MPIFVYRVSTTCGQVHEGELVAHTEEVAFNELSMKPFMASGVFKIDIRMKTASEMKVDKRLRQLEGYRDAAEEKMYPAPRPIPPKPKKSKATWLWWTIFLIILFLITIKLLGGISL